MIPFLIVSCAVCVGLYLNTEAKGKKVSALLCKGLASLCFVLIGLISGRDLYVSRLIICGLILGLVADILVNLRYIFRKKGQQIHLTGILFFLAGHIAYLVAAMSMVDNHLFCFIASIIISIFLILWMYQKVSITPAIKIVGSFYIMAIMLFNILAISSFIIKPSAFAGVFALGAVFFLISDILLVLNTFGSKPRREVRIIHLSLYYLGQVLIACSLILI